MTAFRTCKNCIREAAPCERRDALKASLRGLSVTSVKHRCAGRQPLFSAGQRVSVTWPVGDFDEGYSDETWGATVIKEVGPRFLIKVDDANSDCDTPAKGYVKNPSLFAKTTAARLTALDEPIQAICPTCDRVGLGAYGESGCYGQPASPGVWGYRPTGCLALTIAKATTPTSGEAQ